MGHPCLKLFKLNLQTPFFAVVVMTSIASAGPDIEVVEETAATTTATTEPRSALEENILSKGKHSYYYAHKNNLGVGGDTKNYGTPPRLLKTECKTDGSEKRPLKIITDYAWADGGKKVKVYVTLEGIVTLTDESVELKHDKTSFCLTLQNLNGMNYVLNIPVLNDEITKATFKLKQASNKIVLFLTKENEFSWYDLKKDK